MDLSIFHKMTKDEKQIYLYEQRFFVLGHPHIRLFYEVFKGDSFEDEAELTMAWLALFSGDNLGLYTRYQRITLSNLSDRSKGLYQDLEALSGVFGSPKLRLQKSEQAILLLKDQEDLYLANAYLTHGQILNGNLKLRDAAHYFDLASKLFFSSQLYFASAVALTNAAINRYRLGDIDDVLELEHMMLVSSQMSGETKDYYEILKLPYGMALLEKGNINLAEQKLLDAKRVIDQFGLIHMHGYLEIALIKVYVIQRNDEQLINLKEEIHRLFDNMKYPMMDVIKAYAAYHLHDKDPSWIEQMIYYHQEQKVDHPILHELMMALHQIGKYRYPMDKRLKHIDEARFAGDRASLIQYLLFLADDNYTHQQRSEVYPLLEEVYQLYHHHHLGSAIRLYPYAVSPLLKRMEPSFQLYPEIPKLLTDKEHEILKMIEKGMTNDEIANQLVISMGTVKWHINHIYSKLDVKHRAEAIKKGKDLGLV